VLRGKREERREESKRGFMQIHYGEERGEHKEGIHSICFLSTTTKDMKVYFFFLSLLARSFSLA
jgi:hypothetical protein